MNPLTQSKNKTILPVLVALTLGCFALSPQARAVCQEGCLSNSNTVLGDDALFILTTGFNNTAIGFHALHDNTEGFQNSASGYGALANNTTGNYNTAVGHNALTSNSTASNNTATGINAMLFNGDGFENTATGGNALLHNTDGYRNTATGFNALYNNVCRYPPGVCGDANTATGAYALYSNELGYGCTAVGAYALYSLVGSGNASEYNTATGFDALATLYTGAQNTANGAFAINYLAGSNNTAIGFQALSGNDALSTSSNNTASGASALTMLTTGGNNTATGFEALKNTTSGGNNLALGYQAMLNNTTGASNIALGASAGLNLTTGSNNIIIGANVLGVAGDANTTRIGNSTQTKVFFGGISGKTVANGVGVLVNTSGRLGTIQSSARYKEAIRPMDKASEAILALKPVTFRYKKELDPEAIPQFGLVAEDVEKVNPDLVARDDDGKPYTVRYEAVNAMLLNEFLKEHRKNEEQEATIAGLKKGIADLTATVKEQAAQIQKVSAQLEASRRAQQTMVSNPCVVFQATRSPLRLPADHY